MEKQEVVNYLWKINGKAEIKEFWNILREDCLLKNNPYETMIPKTW